MNQRLRPPGSAGGAGLLQRIVATVAGVGFLIGAALIGTLFLVLAFGFIVIAGGALGLRLWWMQRKLSGTARTASGPGHASPGARPASEATPRRGETLEGDYEDLGRGDPKG